MSSVGTGILRRIELALRTVHGDRMRGVVLFGSEANNTSSGESDVDVLVLLEGPIRYAEDLLTNLEALQELSAEIDRRISPKPIDVLDFETADCPLIRAAREEGVRV